MAKHGGRRTVVDVGVPLGKLRVADASLGFNVVAAVAVNDLVELVAVLGQTRLCGLVAVCGRGLGRRRGSLGRGCLHDLGGGAGLGRLFVVYVTEDAVLLGAVKLAAVDPGIQRLELLNRDAPVARKAVTGVARVGASGKGAVDAASGVADGAGGQQLWEKGQDQGRLSIHVVGKEIWD